MEGLWILIVIFSIISKIMKKSKMAGSSKPNLPKADMDVSAKKFLEQLTENFEEMAREQKPERKTVQPRTSKLRPSIQQAMDERDEAQMIHPVEGECLQEAHMKPSLEGRPVGLEGEPVGSEGKPAGLEGISTEGEFKKGSMAYKDTRSKMMEGSAHPLAAEVDFRAAGKKSGAKRVSGAVAGNKASHSEWSQRIIWKEILSEPVALRKRHGYR